MSASTPTAAATLSHRWTSSGATWNSSSGKRQSCRKTPVFRVTVTMGGYSRKVGSKWVPQPGYYSVGLPGMVSAAHTFQSAWTYMNGIAAGAQAVQVAPR